MSTVSSVRAWEALDSRGRPTVACQVTLSDGGRGTVAVPSGASAGSHEAHELRDNDVRRYAGRGTRQAVAHVNGVLADAVHGVDATPSVVDTALAAVDDSAGFRVVGANAVLAVSLAAACAAADAQRVSLARLLDPTGPLLLPMPMVNVVSGGAHAGGVIDIQDILVIPVGADSFGEAIEWSTAVRQATQDLALERGHRDAVLVADEGGLGLRLPSNRAALELVTDGIVRAGLRLGEQAGLAIDVAASEFFTDGGYDLASEGRWFYADELTAEVAAWCRDFPVLSVEDLLAEDDWAGWSRAASVVPPELQMVGDDLFVTDLSRLRRGIAEGVANAVLVKVNQNGLLSRSGEVLRTAQAAGYRTVVSARSGETEDSWLADLAVGWRAGQIKVGSTHRSERTAKWNRLLELEALEETTFANPFRTPAGTVPTPTRTSEGIPT